jgi:NADPH-dependent 2,4-dienoyl-CoA reductase/sulfur reductase-like enzyme
MLDPETASWLTERLAAVGVQLMLNENINGFEGKTVVRNIQTKSGLRFPAGLAIVAIGTEPNLQLVLNTPLSSPSGCPVNEYLETDEKGIYAVGDIALYPDRIFGGARRVTSYETARQQGFIAGANMTGRKRQRYDVVPTYTSTVVGMRLELVGDFTLPHLHGQLEGSREETNFIVRYRRGEQIVAGVLCNRPSDDAKKLQEEIRLSMQTKQKK